MTPQRRRSIVPLDQPAGCVYYLLLLAWSIAAFVRHTAGGPSGAAARVPSALMFAAGCGLLALGAWTLVNSGARRLAGYWFAAAGLLATAGAIWGAW
jgi:hypothetical protein